MLKDFRRNQRELRSTLLKGKHPTKALVLRAHFVILRDLQAQSRNVPLHLLRRLAQLAVRSEEPRTINISGFDTTHRYEKGHRDDTYRRADTLPNDLTARPRRKRHQRQKDKRAKYDFGTMLSYTADNGQSLLLTILEIFEL